MISFIIPAFNELENLQKMLKSFTWQTKQMSYEIILIDNNSCQDNLDKAYETFKNVLPMYLIKQPKLSSTYSLCRARNIGLHIAKYEWIYLLDSDILCPEHFFSVCIDVLAQNKACIFSGERRFIDTRTLSLDSLTSNILNCLPAVESASNYFLSEDRRLFFLNDIKKSPHPWAYTHGGNMLFLKKKALEINGFDERYDGYWGYEDIDFTFRMLQKFSQLTVEFSRDLYVFHQEKQQATEFDVGRLNKQANPNWERISRTIPGFKEYKMRQYMLIKELSKQKAHKIIL